MYGNMCKERSEKTLWGKRCTNRSVERTAAYGTGKVHSQRERTLGGM